MEDATTMSNRKNSASAGSSDGLFGADHGKTKIKSLAKLPNNSANSLSPTNPLNEQKRATNSSDEFELGLLDEANRKMITLLEENVMFNQTEIGNKLGLSQSAVAMRLDKLRKSGILAETAGVRLKMIGLDMCRVDVNSTDPRAVIEWSRTCPLFMNGSVGVGDANVSLYFVGEGMEMFQHILDEHVRRLEAVAGVHFSPIVSWEKDYVASLNLDVSKSDEPPCKMFPYCPKCPANPNYNGRIWNDSENKT